MAHHKAAIIRLYLEGLTTPEIASRTYHAKKSVDRYIDGFERVRLLAAKHPPEELPLLAAMTPNVVARQEAHLVSLVHTGQYTTAEVADLFGVARSTV